MANIAARASQDLVGNWRIPRDVDIGWDPGHGRIPFPVRSCFMAS
jgi:hypothetical protein